MKTIAHHACSNRGGTEYCLENGPFKSIWVEPDKSNSDNSKNNPFLGEGYYFWDNNVELAHDWGKRHYHGRYFILECEFDLNESNFFDMVGNRRHQIYIIEFIKNYKTYTSTAKRWTIGAIIEFLKNINKTSPGAFNYQFIRALQLKMKPLQKQNVENIVQFNAFKNQYTDLNPKMVICATDIKWIPLHTKKLV